MTIPTLAPDFSEFLKLLNSTGVEYLVIGGYAVGIHGYVRATGDLDIWIRISPSSAASTVQALREFGFATPDLNDRLFLEKGNVIRMGVPPMRLELLTSITGVDFDDCYRERMLVTIGDLTVPVISLDRLRQNKRAAGRAKDLADLENLPE
jgi:hypothetical protein